MEGPTISRGRYAAFGYWVQLTANAAQILAAIGVVIALTYAISEYRLHFSEDQQRRKQAVTDLLLKSVDPRKADDALAALHAPAGMAMANLTDSEFERHRGALVNYFWAVVACVKAELCDRELARDVLCYDFSFFRDVLRVRYGEGSDRAKFDEGPWEPLMSCPSVNSSDQDLDVR